MAGWHHWLDGREFGWTLAVGDGQGSLVCCDSWGLKELDMTERLNWTELNWTVATSCTILVFWMLSFKPAFHSPLSSLSRSSLVSLHFLAIRVLSLAYLRLLIFLPAILIPACDSASPVFHIMCSEYKLNKQSDNIQPCSTPFPILNQSVVLCLVPTVASWPAYKFLRRQIRWFDLIFL